MSNSKNMKKIIAFLLCCATQIISAQIKSADGLPSPGAEDQIYAMAGLEAKPEFPGGVPAFYQYIGDNYKVPNIKGLEGKVLATFVVEKDGSLSNVKILRDIGHGTGEEAKRVLENSPKWIPGYQNGQPVRAQYALPITLKLK